MLRLLVGILALACVLSLAPAAPSAETTARAAPAGSITVALLSPGVIGGPVINDDDRPVLQAACNPGAFRSCVFGCANRLGGYTTAAGRRCMRTCERQCSSCSGGRRRVCRAIE